MIEVLLHWLPGEDEKTLEDEKLYSGS